MPPRKKKSTGKLLGEKTAKKAPRVDRATRKMAMGFGMNLTSIERMETGIELINAPLDISKDVGFSTRTLVQANLPHKDPKTDVWVRTNGDFSLTIQSDIEIDTKTGKRKEVGIPYGTIPRLVMIYLCSEAIRTKSRRISLGDNLAAFMKELGMEQTGGANGSITRFKKQMQRLVSAKIKFAYAGDNQSAAFNASIAKGYYFFWDKDPEQSTLFQSEITLDADFFEEIIRSKIPVHLSAVAALKNSAFGLDLYMWLTYRIGRLNKPIFIKWSDLMVQVGSDYSDVKDFRKRAVAVLSDVSLVWKSLDYEIKRGGFQLNPGEPHIPKQLKQ